MHLSVLFPMILMGSRKSTESVTYGLTSCMQALGLFIELHFYWLSSKVSFLDEV